MFESTWLSPMLSKMNTIIEIDSIIKEEKP